MANVVAGIVLDADWSEPLSGVTVYAFSTSGYTEGSDTTDSNGYFLISGLTDKDWMAKLAGGTVGNILLVPLDLTPPEHRDIRGVEADQHHPKVHYVEHHTGGDQALSLSLLAGSVTGPGHGDQSDESGAVHKTSDLVPDVDTNGYVLTGDGAGSVGMEAPSGHGDHGAVLYSVHQYVFAPNAAPDTAIETGDAQGIVHQSGSTAEIVKLITSHCLTAPVTSAATWQIQYKADGDLDLGGAWTDIDTAFTHTAGAKTITEDSFDDSTIPADSTIRFNVDAVGGTAAKDVSVIMEVWRLLQT